MLAVLGAQGRLTGTAVADTKKAMKNAGWNVEAAVVSDARM